MVVEITLLGPPRVTRDGRAGGVRDPQGDGAAGPPRAQSTARARARCCASCSIPATTRSARAARCGARSRRCARASARSGSTRPATASRCAEARSSGSTSSGSASWRREPATEPRLREAVALFAGDFLEGFSLRDSPDFDDWQIGGGRRPPGRARLGATTPRRPSRGERGARGAPWRARAAGSTLDPLHEPAHRELIRLYAWNGDRAAALEQYRTCVRTLSRELGVAPLEETAALYAQVNDGHPPAARARRAGAVPGTCPARRAAGRAARWSAARSSWRPCSTRTPRPVPTAGWPSSRARPASARPGWRPS